MLTPTPTPFNPIGHFIPTRTPTPEPATTAAGALYLRGDGLDGLLFFVLALAALVAALLRKVRQ
jgi:hypothetical protein